MILRHPVRGINDKYDSFTHGIHDEYARKRARAHTHSPRNKQKGYGHVDYDRGSWNV